MQKWRSRLLGIGAENGGSPTDEVIVPAYTYTASASVVCHVRAKLVLIDSQPDSFEMDYDAVEAAITENTKAIIPVDLGGIPCDYDRIFYIVEKKKGLFRAANKVQEIIGRIAICADAAHAFGAKWHDKMVGSIADFSSFSFHAVKNLTTAEGGALTWNIPGIDDEELYHQAQLYSLHGQSKDALAKTQLGAWEYDIVGPWYKCNMTDITAAIGLKQLERYPHLLKRRKEIIKKYDFICDEIRVDYIRHVGRNYSSSGHLYISRITGCTDMQRREIIIKMAERGVATNVHYKPLPMMTAYKAYGWNINCFPNAYHLFENEVTLPLHTKLSDEEVDYVIKCFKETVNEVRGYCAK